MANENKNQTQAADNAAMEELQAKLAEAEAKAKEAEKAAAEAASRADAAEKKNAEAEAKLATLEEQQQNAAAEAKPDKVKIKIPLVRNAPNEDVQVFINGRQFIIQRGVEVPVPRGVAKILANREKMLEVIDAYDKKHAQ